MRGMLWTALRVCAVLAGLWSGGAAALAGSIGEDALKPADVLYIGDSESLGFFGDNIHKWIAALPDPRGGAVTVRSFWTCGSDVMSWLHGAVSYCGARRCISPGKCTRDQGRGHVPYGPLRAYLDAIRPRVTVLSLGTNFLTTREFYSHEFYRLYLSRVEDLARLIRGSGSACIWVGPPETSLRTKPEGDYEHFVADVGTAARAGGCTFIDSDSLSDRGYILPRDGEGVHYRGDGEKLWSAGVWKQMEPVLARDLAAGK